MILHFVVIFFLKFTQGLPILFSWSIFSESLVKETRSFSRFLFNITITLTWQESLYSSMFPRSIASLYAARSGIDGINFKSLLNCKHWFRSDFNNSHYVVSEESWKVFPNCRTAANKIKVVVILCWPSTIRISRIPFLSVFYYRRIIT